MYDPEPAIEVGFSPIGRFPSSIKDEVDRATKEAIIQELLKASLSTDKVWDEYASSTEKDDTEAGESRGPSAASEVD